ncbi:pancreatic triacylglycerol lipase [Xylocopa sonorina]|uniref:pancreatic triacylglycerol lipase n=1 Tax=Xylocopa sonorina TaxID=1818115 RepID=UPI00403AC4E0
MKLLFKIFDSISVTLKESKIVNSSYYTATDILVHNPDSIAEFIDTDRDTVLFIHGFLENYERPNVLNVINAYLDKNGVNIILLDWGSVVLTVDYYYVSNQIAFIGRTLAEFFDRTEKWIDVDRLHIVGHSLGAHIAGQIGRNLKHATLPRITGLDPAGPLFYPSSCHVMPSDAKTVVMIHTNSRLYGTPYQTGTVDFFPNENYMLQPGCMPLLGKSSRTVYLLNISMDLLANSKFITACIRDACSHQRSVKYYIESLKNPTAFPAYRCFGNEDKLDEEVYFGETTTPKARGIYCFPTNDHEPFSKNS